MPFRKRIMITPFLLLLGLFGGCDKGPPPQKADLEPRLKAAMQIVSLSDRDSTLKAVANDAADLGVGEIVKRAIGSMTNLSDRDSAASSSALRLAKAGQTAAATEVAGMITNMSDRDSTLKKLGEGR
jgi:hypothetical protein